ncbi:hypothetical protein ABWH89_09440 [Hoeflea alexandrii]|uniref:hypothetical protein n=1 Tax=Hoeflea alexandrii TaxID=288436 RepID=UPI0035D01A3A
MTAVVINLFSFEAIMGIANSTARFSAVRNSKSFRIFHPVATVKCDGVPVYRSQVARDVACLFDVDAAVTAWRGMPFNLGSDDQPIVPDFLVTNCDGSTTFVDAPDRTPSVDISMMEVEAQRKGARYRLLSHEEVYDGFRLQNAKDLLRYGCWTVPLGDRIRLLAALDDVGSMPLQECLKAFMETKPVAGIAALILQGFVDVDLDEGPIGPTTIVRPIAR